MNLPDLETCKAIGAEFPESEFVIPYKGNKPHKPILRSEIYNYVGAGSKWIAAPTCEELGGWLRERYRMYQTGECNPLEYDKNVEWFKRLLKSCCMSENETQARAEAVKLILEGGNG